MPPTKQYGHISRHKQSGGKLWRWAILGLIGVWCLLVLIWSSDRVAALFGYHPDLGSPLFQIQGRAFYWPWKLFEWAGKFGGYADVGRAVDQAYLACIGVPLLLFAVYMASQSGLKGREDLHGSARWAGFKDIETMGYLKGEGVYVGGFWEANRYNTVSYSKFGNWCCSSS